MKQPGYWPKKACVRGARSGATRNLCGECVLGASLAGVRRRKENAMETEIAATPKTETKKQHRLRGVYQRKRGE